MANALEEMAYPGRGIILGNNPKNDVFVAYFVTGRSPSSQARRFGQDGTMIFTEPTDPEILAVGNPDLLIYNAIVWDEETGTLAVSNGKQTDTVFASAMCSQQDLLEATRQWNYEPDAPNYTPRISGYVGYGNEGLVAAELGIIRRGSDGNAVREMFDPTDELDTDKASGLAFLLTTYHGGNESPLLPFTGEPRRIGVESVTADSLCEEIGGSLDPKLVVSVAVVRMMPGVHEFESAIRNYRT